MPLYKHPHFYAAVSLINAAIFTACVAVIFFHNPRSRKNIIFAVHMQSVGLWAVFYGLWMLAETKSTAMFHVRMLMIFAILVPPTHLHYILELFGLYTPFRKKLLWLSYAVSFFLLIGLTTPYLVTDVVPKLTFRYWPEPGPLLHVNFASYFSIVVATYLIWKVRAQSPPLVRNQLAWFLFASGISYWGGFFNYPLWYDIELYPIFIVVMGFYPVIGTFLFFRLGISDINLALKDLFVRIMASLLIGGAVGALTYPFLLSVPTLVIFVLLVLITPPLFRPLHNVLKTWVNRTLFKDQTVYLTRVGATMEKIKESTYTYDDLARNIVKSLLNTFPIEMASVYFYDVTNKDMRLRAQEGMRNPLAKDLRYNRTALAIPESDPLVEYSHGHKDVIVRELLETDETNAVDLAVAHAMKEREAELCVPFLLSGRAKGLLILGKKRLDQMYNNEDLDALFSFGRMAEDVMRYIYGMEAELQHTALYSHDMDNDTRSLMQTLEFLHSPLAKNLPREKAEQLTTQAQDVATRLNQTFKLNRERSSLIMRSIRGDYETTSVEINALVRLSCGKFALETEKRGIDLVTSIPGGETWLTGNANDLIRIIDNLLGNAIRYVGEKGRIAVSGIEKGDHYVITVSDDGQGIALEDVERIWGLGYQIKGREKGAAGFGLSIVREIVNLHHGRIHVASPGIGKGTTFTVELPRT